MQSNTITLAVDTANSGTTTNQIYNRYTEKENSSTYISSTHTLVSRDMIEFSRVFPTQSGNYRGVLRPSVKLTEDVTVPGVDATTTVVQPLIANLSFSIPVGTSAAATLELRQRLLAILDNDVVMASLMNALEI